MNKIDRLLYSWKSPDAAAYARKLLEMYGRPDQVGTNTLEWANIDGFSRVVVRDEAVPHDFPMAHLDFVYSVRSITVAPDVVGQLAAVSGSIVVDGLKGEVWARCGKLVKNAVTLGFVEDVVAGRTKASKEEYGKRIKGDMVPGWHVDRLDEVASSMMKSQALAAELNRAITRRVDAGEERAGVIAKMASAAGIKPNTVNQILADTIDMPPKARLSAFARVLGLSASKLVQLAGHDSMMKGRFYLPLR